ncbi:AbfB domain-containing protein, partial [Bacteroides thetaiotaomicron]|uniref:AbfB domain-containing protein n=1 Tax=Bacteroides thetaiotaomicron TaxID=818 RepID=UPI0034D34542
MDASFVVFPGLSDPSCYSFQSAGYPALFLQGASGSNAVSRSAKPDPKRSTWCVNEISSGQVRLRIADGTGRWLENGGLGSVTL